MTTNKQLRELDEFYNAEFPRHERTSCSDEDPSNASPDGFGCKRCNAIIHVRAERLQAECEKLRTAMIEAKPYIDHYRYGGSIYREPAAEAIAIIDAALQEHSHDNQ